MEDRILVVAAHPDDELLGCGGTIALHARTGDHVTAAIACEGESLHYGADSDEQHAHIKAAARILGIEDTRLLGFPDQKLDTITLTKIITPLEQLVREIKPTIIYCHHGGDINRDHELLFKALLVATRPTEQYIQSIYAFDTASSTEWGFPRAFIPDTWVDISSTLQVKLEAMASYKREIRDYPHPRSLRALEYRARSWGNQNCIEAAEVFMTVRKVIRNGETPR